MNVQQKSHVRYFLNISHLSKYLHTQKQAKFLNYTPMRTSVPPRLHLMVCLLQTHIQLETVHAKHHMNANVHLNRYLRFMAEFTELSGSKKCPQGVKQLLIMFNAFWEFRTDKSQLPQSSE